MGYINIVTISLVLSLWLTPLGRPMLTAARNRVETGMAAPAISVEPPRSPLYAVKL
jgi:hypothetical protein